MNKAVVLITGAGGGLGAATARRLARRDCILGIVDVHRENAERVALDCREAGATCFVLVTDLAQLDAPQKMVDSIVEAAGRLDVLINCAAISPVESFSEMTAGAWEKTLRVNVTAVALAMAAASRVMARQRSGHIVNVTSTAARMALPNFAAYAASKAAVDSLTRSGAAALGAYGVRVNSFSPGMMDTPMQDSIEEAFWRLESRGDQTNSGSDLSAFKAQRTARVPLQRRTSSEEMAESLAWLALDSPAYMTAERLNVTGGLDKD